MRLVSLIFPGFAAAALLTAGSASAQCTDLIVTRFDDAPRDIAAPAATCVATGGGCTLRAAVQTAGTHVGCDRVVLSAGTYTVTRPRTQPPATLTQREQDQWRYRGIDGALTLLTQEGEETTIQGAANGGTIIEARSTGDRVFQVSTRSLPLAQTLTVNGLITLRSVTLRGGAPGAMESCGGVELSTCWDDPIGPTVMTLYPPRQLCRYPHDVQLRDVVIEDNVAGQSAGGLCVKPVGYGWNFQEPGFAGNVLLMNVTLRNNRAGTNGGGLEYYNTACSALGVGEGGLLLQGNEAGQNGGGLQTQSSIGLPAWHNRGSDDLNTCDTTPGSRRYRGAPRFRAGLDVIHFVGNRARNGGGLFFTAWYLNLGYALFEGNEATDNGGGMAVQGYVFMANTGFLNNRAGNSGGGLYLLNENAASSNLEAVTVVGNNAGRNGGGIWAQLNPVNANEIGLMVSVVIAENQAGERGGGLFMGPSAVPYQLVKGSLVDNEVTSSLGQGDNIFNDNPNPAVWARASSFRQRPSSDPLTRAESCFGAMASGGQNIDESNTCGVGPADLRQRPLLVTAVRGAQLDGGADVYGRRGPHPLPGSPLVDGALGSTGYLAYQDALERPSPQDGDRDAVPRWDVGAVEFISVACSTALDCQRWAGAGAGNTVRREWNNLQCVSGFCRACATPGQQSAQCPQTSPFCTAALFCGTCGSAMDCVSASDGTQCLAVEVDTRPQPSKCGCSDDDDCGGTPGRICEVAQRRCVDGCRLPAVGCATPASCFGPMDGGAGLCGVSCTSNAQCSSGVCLQTPPRRCVECEVSADCQSVDGGGVACVSQRCATTCTRDGDCPAAQHCGVGNVCVTGFPLELPVDAGVDAGQPDAGEADAGQLDAGAVDAGADAGEVDAGEVDAGLLDAGAQTGVDPEPTPRAGCSTGLGVSSFLLLALLRARRRRQRAGAGLEVHSAGTTQGDGSTATPERLDAHDAVGVRSAVTQDRLDVAGASAGSHEDRLPTGFCTALHDAVGVRTQERLDVAGASAGSHEDRLPTGFCTALPSRTADHDAVGVRTQDRLDVAGASAGSHEDRLPTGFCTALPSRTADHDAVGVRTQDRLDVAGASTGSHEDRLPTGFCTALPSRTADHDAVGVRTQRLDVAGVSAGSHRDRLPTGFCTALPSRTADQDAVGVRTQERLDVAGVSAGSHKDRLPTGFCTALPSRTADHDAVGVRTQERLDVAGVSGGSHEDRLPTGFCTALPSRTAGMGGTTDARLDDEDIRLALHTTGPTQLRSFVAAALALALAFTACDGGIIAPIPLPRGGGAQGGGTPSGGGGGGATAGGGSAQGGGTATGGGAPTGGGSAETLGQEPAIELRRLTAAQVRNTVLDVFGQRFLPTLPLDADELSYGLTSIGNAQATTGPLAAELYFRFHTDLARRLFLDANRRQALVGAGCAPREANDPCVRAFFARMSRVLWRRPATIEETNGLVAVVTAVADVTNRDFWQGLEQSLLAMLLSPNFTYRTELGVPVPGRPLVRRYTAWEIAQRLSFTLWDSVPDAALIAAAEAGQLSTADEVRTQTRRMLADPRGRRGVMTFFSEHFELTALDTFTRDATLFPNLPETLPASMRTELMTLVERATFREGAFQQGRFLDLLDTRSTEVNADLQQVYGLGLTADGGWVSHVWSATDPRAGLLGTAAMLASTSKVQRTSPTLRGRFVRERLLCETIANPPPDVAAEFAEPDGGVVYRNLAERLEQHSVDPRCSGCHRMMDPIGLGLERFDAVGALVDAGHPSLSFSDGGAVVGHIDDSTTRFQTASELGTLLKRDPRVSRCLLRQTLRWVFGRREATAADVAIIDSLTSALEQGGDLREAVVEFTASDAFRVVPNHHSVGADTCAP